MQTRTTPITIDPQPQDDRPIATVLVDLIREQIATNHLVPSEATLRKTPGRPMRLLYNTGRLVAGIAARLTSNEWQIAAPGDRLGADLGLRGSAHVHAALARVVDLRRAVTDKRYRDAQLRAWRAGVHVGRLGD